MSEGLTKDHSVRRWIKQLLQEQFGENYVVYADVYTAVDAKFAMSTVVEVQLVKKLVRGQKSRPPITYKVTFENWKDPVPVANKVKTALMLMEQGDDA